MKTCKVCGVDKPLDEFPKRSAMCKPCHNAYNKEHYKNNTQYYVDKAKRFKETSGDWFKELKNGLACIKCGESYYWCLEFHHLDPAKKDFILGGNAKKGYSIQTLQEEIDKCICVCANCHRKIHGGIILG